MTIIYVYVFTHLLNTSFYTLHTQWQIGIIYSRHLECYITYSSEVKNYGFKFFSADKLQFKGELNIHEVTVLALCEINSRDGNLFVSSSLDRIVLVWTAVEENVELTDEEVGKSFVGTRTKKRIRLVKKYALEGKIGLSIINYQLSVN